MDKLDYVRKRVQKHKGLWVNIVLSGAVSQRTLYKLTNPSYMPSYKTVDTLYNYFKSVKK